MKMGSFAVTTKTEEPTESILNLKVCDKDIDIEEITELLPPWKTYILEGKIIDKDEDFPKVSLRFLLDAHNKENIQDWLSQLEERTKTSYSIFCTAVSKGKYVNFKQRLVCQHNTRSSKVYKHAMKNCRKNKNTNCPSKMTIVLHAVKKRYQGKDREKYALTCEMPCEVSFIATHNHDEKHVYYDSYLDNDNNDHDSYINRNNHVTTTDDEKYIIKNYIPKLNPNDNQPPDQYPEAIKSEIHISEDTIENEITISSSNDNYISEEDTAKNKAESILVGINEIIMDFIDKSPIEVASGLELMHLTMKKITDPSTLASYCIHFGSNNRRKYRGSRIGVEATVISRRKPNISRKKTVSDCRKDTTTQNIQQKLSET